MSTLNPVSPTPFQPAGTGQPSENERPIINFADRAPTLDAVPKKSWHERAIQQLKTYKHRLEEKIPNNVVQNRIDDLGRAIREKFAPLAEFNRKLESAVSGPWYKQLAVNLAKLPLRVARNIVSMLYAIVKSALYAAVHPMKAVLTLAKFLVQLANELTKPETWSKMGMGMIGASVGQTLVTGNVLSLIGAAIGTAMTLGGITASSLKKALEAEKGSRLQAVKAHLLAHAQELPESFATGFCLGLIMGAIQKAQMKAYRVSRLDDAKQYVDRLVKEQQLPSYKTIELDQAGNITVRWYGNYTEVPFVTVYPEAKPYFAQLYGDETMGGTIIMKLYPNSSTIDRWISKWDGFEGYHSYDVTPLEKLGITGRIYPLPPGTEMVSKLGGAVGTTSPLQKAVEKK